MSQNFTGLHSHRKFEFTSLTRCSQYYNRYVSCYIFLQGVCTEAGMYALRERRVHVTQEDFEMAVAKVMQKDSEKNMSIKKLWK